MDTTNKEKFYDFLKDTIYQQQNILYFYDAMEKITLNNTYISGKILNVHY